MAGLLGEGETEPPCGLTVLLLQYGTARVLRGWLMWMSGVVRTVRMECKGRVQGRELCTAHSREIVFLCLRRNFMKKK